MSAEAHPGFAQALRDAIQARGLGLDRIRCRLGEHGVRVSLATLSYRQSGRSRPERLTGKRRRPGRSRSWSSGPTRSCVA